MTSSSCESEITSTVSTGFREITRTLHRVNSSILDADLIICFAVFISSSYFFTGIDGQLVIA